MCADRKKHESLSLHDEVWRVKGIAKYGPFCQRLIKAKVETVQDFLVQLSLDPQGLQQVIVDWLFFSCSYICSTCYWISKALSFCIIMLLAYSINKLISVHLK